MTLFIREIADTASDLDLLERFYDELYVASFPDPDERELLQNMRNYLALRSSGWYGANNYHILLAWRDEQVVAASISDFLADCNCGVIEFLLVDESCRGARIGRAVHDATLEVLNADARRLGRKGVDGVVIELNDPFRVPLETDNYDPFERAMIWDRWGYGRLCFPYVQPALSVEQKAVECLLLGIRPVFAQWEGNVPAAQVKQIVEDYMRWAMRIDTPSEHPDFLRMSDFLAKRPDVRTEPLSVYLGRDGTRPLCIDAVADPSDPMFVQAIGVYQRAFPPGPTAVGVDAFVEAFAQAAGRDDIHYHLWALSLRSGEPICGMASFFVTPRFGFGGYVAFEPPLRGGGYARVALRRAEELCVREEPDARKYYIECALHSVEEKIFLGLGFGRVSIRYFQPALERQADGSDLGPEIALLVKYVGRDDSLPPHLPDGFLDDLRLLFDIVYGIVEPERSATFLRIADEAGRKAHTD